MKPKTRPCNIKRNKFFRLSANCAVVNVVLVNMQLENMLLSKGNLILHYGEKKNIRPYLNVGVKLGLLH
jgi:hypothetical protein